MSEWTTPNGGRIGRRMMDDESEYDKADLLRQLAAIGAKVGQQYGVRWARRPHLEAIGRGAMMRTVLGPAFAVDVPILHHAPKPLQILIPPKVNNVDGAEPEWVTVDETHNWTTMSETLQPTPDLWRCGRVCITYRTGVTIPCSGHKVTPLIRQQAETWAWMDGHDWIHTDQATRQGYLNDAGRFVTGRTGK